MMKEFEGNVEEYIAVPSAILGDSRNVVLFRADGGNHFTHYGIYEGMYLGFDLDKPFVPGQLSLFKSDREGSEQPYKLSDKPLPGYSPCGRLVLSMRKY